MLRVRPFMPAIGTVVLATLLPAIPATPEATALDPLTPAVPLCGVALPASVMAGAAAPPANPVTTVVSGVRVSALVASGSQLYILDAPGRMVRVVTLSGSPVRSFTVPWALASPALAVDPNGDVYVARAPASLVKLNSHGAEVWSRTLPNHIEGIFVTGTGTDLRVGAVQRGVSGSTLFSTTGGPAGSSVVTGSAFAPTPDGGLLATDTYYVRQYGPSGDLRLVFGDARKENEPAPTAGPFHFYQQGGAVAGPDGTIYVADATRGIHAANSDGFYRGMVAEAAVGGSLTERSWMAPAGDRVYFAAGPRFDANQRVHSIRLADLAALVAAPKPPLPVLGFGAGLITAATGQYFRPGQTPAVTARFDPWWATIAPRLRLAYTVRERKDVVANRAVAPTEVALPSTAAELAAIPLSLPSSRPGAYEVDARLIDTAANRAVVGATCLNFTVGAPGHRLDFAALPPGTDHGGPAPARGVALADVLGTGGVRARVEWSKLLPGGSPTAAGPLNLAQYESAFTAAAAEAKARGVAFWVQVADGTGVDKALVENGSWEQRVRELVGHFKGIVPAWEAWNEPNNSYGPAGSYVTKVLAPFARAVRAADPAAKVIGGSTVEVDVSYWRGIVDAGGLASMDVAAVHLHAGHGRAWEEQGNLASVRALKELLARAGAGAKPIWNTESAWWSNGPANLHAQADKVARALLWMRVLGIERWNYFMLEAGYGDYGLSYSMIEATSEVDYVKPAALATMTTAGQLAGRPFSGFSQSGIPHAYAAHFGPRPGGGDALMAAWTDDLRVPATLTNRGTGVQAVTVTDLLGDATTVTLGPGESTPLELTGSPLYITAPAAGQLALSDPGGGYGRNVAAGAAGATATASSSIPANPPAAAIDGVSDVLERGDLSALPGWTSAPGDGAPALTVRLARAEPISRIVVSTHSIASVIPGLRSYDVEVQAPDGTWSVVGEVRDQFHARRHVVAFPPRPVTALRLSVTAVNHGGLAGGPRPWFWPTDAPRLADASQPWYGPAVVLEVEAYDGSGVLPTARAERDYDGDGRADLAVWRPPNGLWWVSGTENGSSSHLAWGALGDVPVPADYDGDGRLDLAVWRPSTGIWYLTSSRDGGPSHRHWGTTGDVPVPADYDGDGRADVAVWRPATGTWHMANSGTATTTAHNWGTGGDVPVPADYDGDGRADPAVWRPATGTWHIANSGTVTTTARTWGMSGDLPVPADYDGDGRADVAVWRPATGTWSVATTGDGAVSTRALGSLGDLPVPGDYDGDGRAEMAVWRPSTGEWWVSGEPGAAALLGVWGTAGDVPVV